MSVHFSKITSKAQTTAPRAVRKELGVEPGDRLLWRVENGRVLVEKAPPLPAGAHAAWGPSWNAFAEDWLSPEDCAAFDDL